MRSILSTIAALLLSGLLFGQQPSIVLQGKVTDQSSGEALTGVAVAVPAINKGVSTGADGRYLLELPAGEWQVVVSMVGYRKAYYKVSASQELDVAIDVAALLEEVIIQSVRAGADAPITQSTIEKQQIDALYVGQDAPFILERLTPSVVTYSESGTRTNNYSTMRLRGMDMKRINYTLNGIPLNDMIDHGVYFSNFPGFANSLESVEVQRGVGTSSNGTSSYAGSVNFESVNLEGAERGAEVQLGAGSFESFRGSAEYNTGMLENNMAFYGRFEKINSQGYRHNAFTDSYSFFFSGGYFGEKDLIKINAFTANSRNGLAYSPSTLGQIEEDPRHNPLNENDTDNFGQQFVQLQHVHRFSALSTLNSSLYYGGAGGDFFWSGDFGDGNLSQINYPLRNDHVGLLSTYTLKNAAGNWSVDAGMHLYRFYRMNAESIMPDDANPYYQDHSEKDELAFFARGNWHLSEQFSLFGDVQFRHAALTSIPDYEFIGTADQGEVQNDWTFLNPKIGLTYDFTGQHQLYASYGRSHREPRRVDLLGGYTLDAAALENLREDDFQHETVDDIEMGYRLTGNNVQVQVNGFLMMFTNEITENGEVIEFGSQVRTNVPSSYRTGIELDGQLLITDGLVVQGNFMYMRSRIDAFTFGGEGEEMTGLTQPYSPEVIANVGFDYQVLPKLRLGISGRYVGSQYMTLDNDPQFTIPDYTVMDAHVEWTIGRHSLRLDLNNLFSADYYSFGQPLDLDWDGTFDEVGYFVNAPFNAFGTLVLKF
jgi:iron complex outermembrane receptor protein